MTNYRICWSEKRTHYPSCLNLLLKKHMQRVCLLIFHSCESFSTLPLSFLVIFHKGSTPESHKLYIPELPSFHMESTKFGFQKSLDSRCQLPSHSFESLPNSCWTLPDPEKQKKPPQGNVSLQPVISLALWDDLTSASYWAIQGTSKSTGS